MAVTTESIQAAAESALDELVRGARAALPVLPPLDVTEWVDTGSVPIEEARAAYGYSIRVGEGPSKGTYSTKMPRDDGHYDLLTYRYDQAPVEEPIKSEVIKVAQPKVVVPYAAKAHIAGAEVLDYTNTYMEEAHTPENLLRIYEDKVGRDKPIDTLVGTGLSGTIAVVQLARDLGLNYLIVRKPDEKSHASHQVEGRIGKHWLFVDDLVSSGGTFSRVWDAVAKIRGKGFVTSFEGVLLYNDSPRFIDTSSKHKRHMLHDWLEMSETYGGEFDKSSKRQPKGELAW